MNDSKFSSIRNLFESGSRMNQSEVSQGSPLTHKPSSTSVSYISNGTVGKFNRYNEPFPSNQQQRRLIRKDYECNEGYDNHNGVRPADEQIYENLQTKLSTVVSCPDQTQNVVGTLRKKPPVAAAKPSLKRVDSKNPTTFSQPLSQNPSSSINSKDKPNKAECATSSNHMLHKEDQIPTSVSKIRQQLEQKFSQQQINTIPQRSGSNILSRPVLTKTNSAEGYTEAKSIRTGISDVRIDEQAGGTLQQRRMELEIKLQTPIESGSLLQPGKPVEIQFYSSLRGAPPSIARAEASNLHIISPFNNEQVFSDSEFDDEFDNDVHVKDELTSVEEPIYSNLEVINKGYSDDLPKNLLRLPPRQRTSYAEPRVRSELKPSMSFNPSDIKKTMDSRLEGKKQLQHIIEELIKTEKDYVENLKEGIRNYMVVRKDIPRGLTGKYFYLFGNIEKIFAFHRDTLLPALIKNQNDLKKLFAEFLSVIEENRMYDYVIYTMNKRRSLEICTNFAPYFTYLQQEMGQQLGIDNFLLQPIQRLPRYKLLMEKLLVELFKVGDKEATTLCCRLEHRIRTILDTANEADQISDIMGWSDMNVCSPDNKFLKSVELIVYDTDRRMCYDTKVFIFEKCMIYTEVRDKLIFRGYYDPSLEISLKAQKTGLAVSYANPKLQECIFHGEPHNIKCFKQQMEDMVNKNKTKHAIEKDYNQRRNYSHHSIDSGLGNMFTLQEQSESE